MTNVNLTREELLKLHKELTDKAASLMKAKNQDYAHEGDVFRNFRLFGGLGILVRLSDKLARLRSFEENNKFEVQDEKLVDTVADAINYAILYYAFKQEGKLKIEVKGGPYCCMCNQNPADFRWEVDKGFGVIAYYCSNCCAEHNISTADMTVMETL